MVYRIVGVCLCAWLFALAATAPANAELRFVTRGNSNRIIVFVDGLQSDPAKSFRWGDGVGSWPELMSADLVVEQKQLPLARYDTAILSFAGLPNERASVPQLATRGLSDLKSKGILEGYESVIFVAHGAGGLVLKSMLVQSSIAGSVSLASNTKAVFLLSVPAEGRPAANFLAALAQNQTLAVSFGAVDVGVFLQGLESLWSEYLSRRSAARRLEVYCRSETEQSFGIKVAAGQYTTEGCDDNGQESGSDFNSIARPASRDAGVYRWVRTHLAAYFQRFPSDPGKAKPSTVIAAAEGTATAAPAAPTSVPVPQKTEIAPAPTLSVGKPAATAQVAPSVSASESLSPAETSNVIPSSKPATSTTSPSQPMPSPAQPGVTASAAPPARFPVNTAGRDYQAPEPPKPARTGDWTFSLKGPNCNLPTQLWVVKLHDHQLKSDNWTLNIARDGKFKLDTLGAGAAETIIGQVNGILGKGIYVYTDPIHAITCRTPFKLTWRLPVQTSYQRVTRNF